MISPLALCKKLKDKQNPDDPSSSGSPTVICTVALASDSLKGVSRATGWSRPQDKGVEWGRGLQRRMGRALG